MGDQLLKKIADELKEARKKKKVSIDQIFTKTRIDKKYLSAIEEGDFSIMPDVYLRAFIKEYALNVGLNPTEILEKYTLAQKGIDFEETISNADSPEILNQPFEKKKYEKIIDAQKHESHKNLSNSSMKIKVSYYYAIVAVLMLLFILVIYKLFLTEPNNEIITEKPFEEIVQNENKISTQKDDKDLEEKKDAQIIFGEIDQKKIEVRKPEPNQNKTLQAVQNENIMTSQNDLSLTIVSSDKSWIRTESDDKDNMEFTIDEGVTKVLNAKNKFYLHIGNSGGIKLYLNNKDLFFSGSPGKVRKIFVTKNGIEYLRRTPVVNAE